MALAPSAAQLDEPLLAALFKLTRAEQAVARRLALGQDTTEIAQAPCIQTNTVRSHIKQVLSESGAGHQAEFVARVWHAQGRGKDHGGVAQLATGSTPVPTFLGGAR